MKTNLASDSTVETDDCLLRSNHNNKFKRSGEDTEHAPAPKKQKVKKKRDKIHAIVRVRPLNDRERHHSTSELIRIEDGTWVHIKDKNGMSNSFNYDAVYGPESTQSDVYEGTKHIVDAVREGYNGTIVAYGQTGSGKSHTIFGNEFQKGIFQQSINDIYAKIKLATTHVSYVQIYKEDINDLLATNVEASLPLRESGGEVYVEDIRKVPVSTVNEAMDILRQGMEHRNTAETAMNDVSSRSHAIFILWVQSKINEGGITKIRKAKFTLVDLAGSERQKMTRTDGVRLKEANNINKSLSCLGQVIDSLVEGKGKHVPYRDSKLTRLLKNSFGGNSKTCLIATVTPSLQSRSETLSTLRFAQRAKRVKNNAVLKEDTPGSVGALQAKIARLESELAARRNRDEVSTQCTAESKLAELKAKIEQLQSKLDAVNNDRTFKDDEVELLKFKLKKSEDSDEKARSEVTRLRAENERLTHELEASKSMNEEIEPLSLIVSGTKELHLENLKVVSFEREGFELYDKRDLKMHYIMYAQNSDEMNRAIHEVEKIDFHVTKTNTINVKAKSKVNAKRLLENFHQEYIKFVASNKLPKYNSVKRERRDTMWITYHSAILAARAMEGIFNVVFTELPQLRVTFSLKSECCDLY